MGMTMTFSTLFEKCRYITSDIVLALLVTNVRKESCVIVELLLKFY